MGNLSMFELTYKVVKSGIEKAIEAKSKDIKTSYFFKGYVNYPEITYQSNGFPKVYKSIYGSQSIIDYEKYFKINNTEDNKIDLEEIEGYNLLKNMLLKCDKYVDTYGFPKDAKSDLDIIGITIQSHVLDLISKSILTYGEENELDETQFIKIYQPLENRVMNSELWMDIYIPILFTKFEFEEYIISDTISIVKMDDVFQQSRSEITSYSESTTDSVLMSATHAMKLKNYSIENKNSWLFYSIFDNLNFYPLDVINSFFSALRINNDILVGYAQIICCPVKWVEKYKADLMYLKGVATKSYPIEFNNFYWNRDEFPIIHEDSLSSIKNLFQIIIEKRNKKINLASSRLENSFYRNNEGDKVIDLVIGLESLLSDNEKGEITYKLSLRAAYLLQKSSLGESKLSVFNNMKAIYSYRSAIVHGQSNLEKKRYITDEGGNKKLVLDVASKYLKECIKVLLLSPEFLDAISIDKELVLK